jgi:hypothetical protein
MGLQPEQLRKRARFQTEDEILFAIDDTKSRVHRLRKEAEKFDKLAEAAFARGHSGLAWREDADRKRAKADRVERGYLQRLKRTLAAFRTQLLPGFGEDRSIQK